MKRKRKLTEAEANALRAEHAFSLLVDGKPPNEVATALQWKFGIGERKAMRLTRRAWAQLYPEPPPVAPRDERHVLLRELDAWMAGVES